MDTRIVSLTDWIEGYPHLYVQLVCNPAGIGFPDEVSPDTRNHTVRKTVRVGDLDQILFEHAQENIWRSWQLFADALCLEALSYVPLFFDIDNEDNNPEGAYNLTQDCINWLECMNQFSAPDRIRIVFSGKKGFHIEARPNETVDNRLFRESLLDGLHEMGIKHGKFRNCFRNGTIDSSSHEFIRLTGSFNSWKEGNAFRKRKVIQLSLSDYRKLGMKGILEKSEAG